MATTVAACIDLGNSPQTPKSKRTFTFHTPTTRSPNTKENAISPRRTKLFNTLKSLSGRRSVRGESETNSPKSISKRKSAWDLFGRLSQKGSSSDDQSVSTDTTKERSVSPFKKPLMEVVLPSTNRPTVMKRRKSLGDVIGTIKKKAVTRYNTISYQGGRHPESMTVWDETLSPPCRFPAKTDDHCELLSAQPLYHTLRNSTPALSLHLPGATFEDMDPAAVVARMVDDFKTEQTRQLVSTSTDSESAQTAWTGSDTVTLTEACEVISKDTLTQEQRGNPQTPESYLCALIDSYRGQSEAGLSDQQDLSPCPSPEKYQAVQGIDFLEDDCSVHKTSAENRPATECVPYYPLDIGLTLSFEPSDNSLHRDQRLVVSVREVYSDSEYSEDFDPNFCEGTAERNDRDEKPISTTKTANNHLTERIRMTLGKMTKNYHAYGSDASGFDQNDREAWSAIVLGDQILNNGTPPKKTRRISSVEDGFERHPSTNRILEESVKLRSPSERFEFIRSSLRSTSPHETHCKPVVPLPSTRSRKSESSLEDEIQFMKLGSLKRLGMKARVPLKPDQYTIGPYHLDFPQVGSFPAERYTFEYKSEVISKWYDQSLSGRYARFCIYDPKTKTYTGQPRWAAAPDLRDLRRSGQEALWLPKTRTDSEDRHHALTNKSLWEASEAEELMRLSMIIPRMQHNLEGAMPLKNTASARKYLEASHGLSHVYFSSQSNGSPWPNSVVEAGQNSSCDMETSFLASNTTGAIMDATLSTDTTSEPEDILADGEILSDDVSDVSVDTNSDLARSFIGSQFPETQSPVENSPNSLLPRHNHIEVREDDELLFTPIKNEEPVVGKTWFDLAREYKASHLETTKATSDSHGHEENSGTSTAIYDEAGITRFQKTYVSKTWFDLAEEWKTGRSQMNLGERQTYGDSQVFSPATNFGDEGIQMRNLPPVTEYVIKAAPLRGCAFPGLPDKPTTEHIEDIRDELFSKVPVTELNSNSALTKAIREACQQESENNSDIKSAVSYTSYIEAEMQTKRLWQTMYPQADGHDRQDFPSEKLSIHSRSQVENSSTSMYPDAYGRGRQGLIHGDQQCDEAILRPASVTSFASGSKFTEFAEQLREESIIDTVPNRQETEETPLSSKIKAAGPTYSLGTDTPLKDVPSASTEYIPPLKLQKAEYKVEKAEGIEAGPPEGLSRQTKRSVGALVDIFQAHGLMSGLKSPFMRSSSPSRGACSPAPSNTGNRTEISLKESTPLPPRRRHRKGRVFQFSSSSGNSSDASLVHPFADAPSTRWPLRRVQEMGRANDSDLSDAETEVSNFGETLERCSGGTRDGRGRESSDEERNNRDNDLYG
ncbi:hypothetical protein GLAREA_00884 [Glarea lozoyensis ATCC 20868]|uniref:Uncharacterized protein n=1 Tax=Glarea lozoyensis (strain ATCC 20868 / MF5171) TaxID=1116229 RepID=S3CXR5_GLAL2|nr:uncharacterized protein GLAREA_00884 [Glarea lozoyensis ATCC 20868]EPE29724.1 hypothetical protein GLAREA_00884 [Glarea lozoyensis ATCC 20868]